MQSDLRKLGIFREVSIIFTSKYQLPNFTFNYFLSLKKGITNIATKNIYISSIRYIN